jgi:hypothetical protein
MRPISFKRHRFPPIIRHAIWLYARFTLSFRDVEELLADRGINASYETVRRWFSWRQGSSLANICSLGTVERLSFLGGSSLCCPLMQLVGHVNGHKRTGSFGADSRPVSHHQED